MAVLTIDESKCKKDRICARECPSRIIELENGGYPQIPSWAETSCTACGHCVAVCPHGALSHTQVPVGDCTAIDEKLVIDAQWAEQFLRSRRSIRLYEDRPVEKEKIQKLIEISRYAPTAVNSQSVQWLVVTDKALLKETARITAEWFRKFLNDEPRVAAAAPHLVLTVKNWDSGHDSVLRGAPVLVVASAPKEASNGMVDLTLALCYMTLMAPTMGLGSCWAGLVQRSLLTVPSLKEMLGVPAAHPHHYPVMLGYTKAKYYRLPERKPPKITFK